MKSTLLSLLIIGLVSTGCVRRRMTVRTDPPGATVYVDDQEIGTTPVSSSFVYYGTRKIQVVKDGFETETVMNRMRAPWYQIPPLDFFSENLFPREIRDERIIQIEMEPQKVIPTNVLLDRAQQLRTSTIEGYSIPTPPTIESSAPMPPRGGELPPPFRPGTPATPVNTPQPFYPPG
ncbi:MAG: PEGA domain-containing protein [Pirellulaceae bacterium]|nr:PEGA domain-containing protein [Pirellulaceae bacterium]